MRSGRVRGAEGVGASGGRPLRPNLRQRDPLVPSPEPVVAEDAEQVECGHLFPRRLADELTAAADGLSSRGPVDPRADALAYPERQPLLPPEDDPSVPHPEDCPRDGSEQHGVGQSTPVDAPARPVEAVAQGEEHDHQPLAQLRQGKKQRGRAPRKGAQEKTMAQEKTRDRSVRQGEGIIAKQGRRGWRGAGGRSATKRMCAVREVRVAAAHQREHDVDASPQDVFVLLTPAW